MSGQSYPPVSRLNSQAGLQSHITSKPIQCAASFDDTSDGGLYHRCNQVAGHDGIHRDGHGQLWVDRDGWLQP